MLDKYKIVIMKIGMKYHIQLKRNDTNVGHHITNSIHTCLTKLNNVFDNLKVGYHLVYCSINIEHSAISEDTHTYQNDIDMISDIDNYLGELFTAGNNKISIKFQTIKIITTNIYDNVNKN